MPITGEVFVTVAGLSVMIAAHINPVLSQSSIAVSQDTYWHTGSTHTGPHLPNELGGWHRFRCEICVRNVIKCAYLANSRV